MKVLLILRAVTPVFSVYSKFSILCAQDLKFTKLRPPIFFSLHAKVDNLSIQRGNSILYPEKVHM